MKAKITKRSVEGLTPQASDLFLWDTQVPGFGCKVTSNGSRIYVLQYRQHGPAKRFRLGRHGSELTADEARVLAIQLRGAIAQGKDPALERAAERNAPTLVQFAKRYLDDHAAVKKKASSYAADERNLRNHILPALGHLRVADVTRADVARFHRGLKNKPGAGNRSLALLSKMFQLAELWGLRTDGTNPTRHIEKYPERRIERFLSEVELERLGAALRDAEAAGAHPSAIAAIRLLVFTGCRRDEILDLEWDHVDFLGASLRLPESKTGAKTVPLGAPALEVLAGLPRLDDNRYVLPGAVPGQRFVGIGKVWSKVRAEANLQDVRLHDLRHSFASTAASLGESLLVIGSLLGHADAASTSRYAHLSDDPRRAAANRISERLQAAMSRQTARPTRNRDSSGSGVLKVAAAIPR